ncbi:MAG: hypothetical protein GX070_06705 [Alcaligenaceae bacterium]|nr:hypothetical protein [Alcaligenaceae bacterium]
MKFTPKVRLVKYCNFLVNVPEEYQYLAADSTGVVYAYLSKPQWNKRTNSWVPVLLSNQLMEFIEVGKIKPMSISPEASLQKIEK